MDYKNNPLKRSCNDLKPRSHKAIFRARIAHELLVLLRATTYSEQKNLSRKLKIIAQITREFHILSVFQHFELSGFLTTVT